MPEAVSIEDHRQLIDRRSFGWRTVACGFLLSRRRRKRRDADAEPLYSDWHHPWLFFLAVCTMLMSCMDAVMTLELLNRGAYEANPIMATVMGHSLEAFAISKMLLTALGIFALVFLARARFMNRLRTGSILTAVFSMYACLICYEFVFLVSLL